MEKKKQSVKTLQKPKSDVLGKWQEKEGEKKKTMVRKN